MSQRGKLPLQEAVEWVSQACSGLADAHALGLVHRDLKPSMPQPSAAVELTDFGGRR